MNTFREVNDDILKDWLEFREENCLCNTTAEDKEHTIQFDDIGKKILNNVPKNNKKYVMKQLDLLDKNYIDYISYWNEKYYRNGFCDGVQIIVRCFDV